jgi:hypothetical protein
MGGDWILSPLTQYGMLGAGLIASLTLFITAKLEISAVTRRVNRSENEVRDRLQAAEGAVELLRDAERSRERMAEGGGPTPAGSSSLNLTKRAQAVRMHRRGEPASTIAAATRAPLNEIELLIKLHELQ